MTAELEFPESFTGTISVVWYPFVAAFTGASTSVAITWGPVASLDFLVYWCLSWSSRSIWEMDFPECWDFASTLLLTLVTFLFWLLWPCLMLGLCQFENQKEAEFIRHNYVITLVTRRTRLGQLSSST